MKNKQSKNYVFIGITLAILILYTVVMGLMVYMTIITSLKDFLDYKLNPIGLPEIWMWSNYVDAFSAFNVILDGGRKVVYLDTMLLYSLIYAAGSAFISATVPALVAYLVAKYRVWLNEFIYGTVIVAMVLPIVGALPSEIQVAKFLGIYNTLYGVWIMKATYLGTNFLIYYGTFKGLSDEYIEAATIDGAGQFTVMLQVVLPLVKTTIFAIMILAFIGSWNDYQTPLIYMQDYPTAAVGLFRYVYMPSQAGAATSNMQMAGCMILFIPVLILFLIFRDVFMGNLTVGGLKG